MKLTIRALLLILSFIPNVSNTHILHSSNNTSDTPRIKVIIEGVRTDKGKIVVAVFKDQEDFKNRNPVKRIELNKAELESKDIILNLESGTYGISVLDDENSNNKMDYTFFGMPKEGFGFSNYYHKGLSKPHFNDFKFDIINTSETLIKIKLRYM